MGKNQKSPGFPGDFEGFMRTEGLRFVLQDLVDLCSPYGRLLYRGQFFLRGRRYEESRTNYHCFVRWERFFYGMMGIS